MYGELHVKSNVDRFSIKRKEGGRGLMSVERCIREEEKSLGFNVATCEENLIRGNTSAERINAKDTVTSGIFQKQKAQELNKNCSEKIMHRQFVKEMPEKDDKDKNWPRLSKSDLKIGTEAFLCVAQEHAIRTNYVKYHINKTSESPLWRLCGVKG